MSDIRPALADLFWLAEHADDLSEARLKGTPRRWHEAVEETDPEKRAQRAAHAAAEHADRSVLAIGEHPAPLHVEMLDLLVDLLATADDLAEQIAQAAGVDRLPAAPSSFADPVPYLRHAAAWLKPAVEADSRLLAHVESETARLRSLIAACLGDNLGNCLRNTCPFCKGGAHQARTLRFRIVKSELDRKPDLAIVCESDVCEPPESFVGQWVGKRPAWVGHRYMTWLNQMIDAIEQHAVEKEAS